MPNKKNLLLFIFIVSFIAVGYAFFVQFNNKLEPCPLCIAERLIIGIIGILALIFYLHNPQNILMRIYGLIITIIGLFGIKIAIHHIWLINLPPEQQPSSCGMPLNILFKQIPLKNFISYILKGDAECTIVSWKIFNINAPTLVLILCFIFTLIGMYLTLAKQPIRERRFY